jgi:hypothetical protein
VVGLCIYGYLVKVILWVKAASELKSNKSIAVCMIFRSLIPFHSLPLYVSANIKTPLMVISGGALCWYFLY